MATLSELRRSIEARLGIRTRGGEESVKLAYGDLTGFQGDQLDHEFAVALGRQVSGTPVEAGGRETDDPLDVVAAAALPDDAILGT